MTSTQSATYSEHVLHDPTDFPKKFASAKSNTIGIACFPNRFITFSFDGLQRQSELLKSAQRSAASAKNVLRVRSYAAARSSDNPARVASLLTCFPISIIWSLIVRSAVICRSVKRCPHVDRP